MFIFWGKKIIRKKIGFVADYCPICRGPKQFKLTGVRSVSHVYYLSFGSGVLLGHEITCQECGTAYEVAPNRYAEVAKSLLPIAELTNLTFPKLAEAINDQLTLDRKVLTDPFSLSAEQRQKQILRPLLLLSPKVERRFATTEIDKEIGISFLIFIALVVSSAKMADTILPANADAIILGAVLLGLLIIVIQFVKSGRRYMRREIVPRIAANLAPLRPTEEELASVLSQLSRLGHKVGKKLKLADLMPVIQATQI